MKLFSAILLIAAIICAVFADNIDKAVKGERQLRKVILVCSVGVVFLCGIAIACFSF